MNVASNVNPADTVSVSDGTYDELVTVDVEGLTLEGAGADATTIVGQGSDTLATESDGTVDGVTVRGFTVEAPSGSSAVDVSTTGENTDITFSENTFVGDSGASATVFVGGNSENIDFDSNTFSADGDNVDKHLYLGGEATYGSDKASATSQANAHNVTDNTFNSYDTNAVEFEGQHGEIAGNTFDTDTSGSVAIDIPGAVDEGNNVNIDANNIDIQNNVFNIPDDATEIEFGPDVENAPEE